MTVTPATDGSAPPTTDVFDKVNDERLDQYHLAESLGVLPFYRELEGEIGPTVTFRGRRMVMLGSNNYLGLTTDPRVRAAAIAAIERYGTGVTGSRLLNGTLDLHRTLEEELADWVGMESSLVFTTGYSANVGLISAVVGAADALVVDSAGHASMVDGARLGEGALRAFRHNRPNSLRRTLRVWREQPDAGGVLVAVDGIYSMEGDWARLPEIAALCQEFGARLLVDEAHALGVVGPQGAGTAAASGVAPDLIMGTFSKSLASCGGFIAGPKAVIDYLKITCRPLMFTASGVPAALGAAREAARIARVEDWRRETVLARAARLRQGLADLGYSVGEGVTSAIVPVHVEDIWEAGDLWKKLLDQGVYTNCAIPPAVPRPVLRTSVMATHTEADIDRALAGFEAARIHVGLTGATGHLGALLLQALAADPDVEAVHTVARRGLAPGTPARVVHTRADLRSLEARRALAGVDVLFHLGFQLWVGKGGRTAMESVNVAGTANVLDGAPSRVVLASSAAVYGAWPDNACPLLESAPARPNAECAYAVQKLAAERLCAGAAPTVSLRVAAVLGPQADPSVRRAVSGYRLAVPVMAGVPQALQFVDQDDVVSAFLAAGRAQAALPPVLNVAPADWIDGAGVAAVSGGRVVALPRRWLMAGSTVGRRLGLLPFGPDRSVLLSGPLALDPATAATHLGWRATRSSGETLSRMLASI